MKNLVLSLLLSVYVCTAYSQKLIFNGDTLSFYSDVPFRQYPDFKNLATKLSGFMRTGETSCFDCLPDIYNTEWCIINNELYLTNIYSHHSVKPKLKVDINKLFSTTGGKVKADWVTTDIWIPIGKPIGLHDIMDTFYSAELHLVIVKGKVTEAKQFDYPTARTSSMLRNGDSTSQFIYSKINWNKIPDLKNDVKKVLVTFLNSPSGKPENVRILRGIADDPIYNSEAIRVMVGFPVNIFYRHDQFFKQQWTIPIAFSEENRRKYAR